MDDLVHPITVAYKLHIGKVMGSVINRDSNILTIG
jgi:hypothetical protein